jgi:CRP-like cAMP-binding protein
MAEHPQRNLILSSLDPADLDLLVPYLEDVELPIRKVLGRARKRISTIYFPERGFVSVVANGANQRPIEVGIIGREGMTGIAVLLGDDRSSYETFVQVAGEGKSISARALQEAIKSSLSLHKIMLRYVHYFLDQTAQTAVANGRSSIEERLARWLLMAADRVDDEELPLTHEFLAMMLCVRRPGVTIAVQELEREGVIERRRGRIFITDRKALEKKSSVTYAVATPAWGVR